MKVFCFTTCQFTHHEQAFQNSSGMARCLFDCSPNSRNSLGGWRVQRVGQGRAADAMGPAHVVGLPAVGDDDGPPRCGQWQQRGAFQEYPSTPEEAFLNT